MTEGLPRLEAYAPPPDHGLLIVYQDEHLLVIDKPAGLLSVPGRGADLQDCALHRVQQRFAKALLVHRLDEATSGLLLFALTSAAQKALGAAFAARQIHKTYHAWVHGVRISEHGCVLPQHDFVLSDSGVIDAPIAVDWPNRPLRKIDFPDGKSAITHFQLLSKNEHSTHILCRLEPQTGRTHQLRVHMQHIGHPIVGDQLYGLPEDTAPRLMLHASGLRLQHPAVSESELCLESLPPF